MKIKIIALFALLVSDLIFADLIKIKTQDGQNFTIDMDLKSTILQLKERIKEQIGIPVRHQNLRIDFDSLHDNWQLLDYKEKLILKNDTEIQVYDSRHVPTKFIVTVVGIPQSLGVNYSFIVPTKMKVLDLKTLIAEKFPHLPSNDQIIKHGNKELDDSDIIDDVVTGAKIVNVIVKK
jgi:hypothetical protein